MGEACRVDDDAIGVPRGRLYPLDEDVLGVALESLQSVPIAGREGIEAIVNVGEGTVTIVRRLTHAEQIEIGTMDDQDLRH